MINEYQMIKSKKEVVYDLSVKQSDPLNLGVSFA
jgi:hypothetical protein